MGEFDSLSPEFHAWVDSMTPEQRLQVLKRFYEKWDPPASTEQPPQLIPALTRGGNRKASTKGSWASGRSAP